LKNYPTATGELCDLFEDLIVDGDFKFDESSFLPQILRLAKLITVVPKEERHHVTSSGKKLRGYALHPSAMKILLAFVETDGDCFDCCSEICSFNVLAGVHLPLEMRVFASQVLIGEISRPKKSSRPIKKNWQNLAIMHMGTLMAKNSFGLYLTRNDEGPNRYSACDAVAEALTICGRETKYSEVKYLAVHPDKKKLREQVEVTQRLMSRFAESPLTDLELNTDEGTLLQKTTLLDVLDIMGAYVTDEK
jgi:hypothetical protein